MFPVAFALSPARIAEIVIVLLVLLVLFKSVRIANQYERGVVFRLGKYNRTAGPGIYIVWFLVEWQTRIDLRTITAAVEQVALTALRAVLGEHSLDEILKSQDTISSLMQKAIDTATEPWGVKVERVQMKSVEIPPSMQRAMAQEAEALREKRARLIKAEAELDAAEQLRQAAEVIMQNPAGLELRRMQMITEVGAEQNTMTIIMMPSEFVAMAKGIADAAKTVANKA